MTGDKEETRFSSGMLVTAAGDAYLPVRIAVRVSDSQPCGIDAPEPSPNGRYVLLAPGWKTDVVRTDGQWHLGEHTPSQGRSAEEVKNLKPEEKKQRNEEMAKRVEQVMGRSFAKKFMAQKDKDRDHER